MRIQFSVVGTERHANVWAYLDAVPREGETVALPGVSQADGVVRTVVWYLEGTGEADAEGGPFVYVVVGQRRRS